MLISTMSALILTKVNMKIITKTDQKMMVEYAIGETIYPQMGSTEVVHSDCAEYIRPVVYDEHHRFMSGDSVVVVVYNRRRQ